MKNFGYFEENEFVITDALAPPRAQVNFLWNDRLISGVNQFGTGEGIFNGRVMLYNDPRGRAQLIQNGTRCFYLRDNESGEFWNAGNFPVVKAAANYQCRVGLGYSIFEMEYDGIFMRSKVFVPREAAVEVWEFEIENRSGRSRDLSLVPYVEWYLGGYSMFSSRLSYLRSEFNESVNAVSAWNLSDEVPHEHFNAFLATDGNVQSWCGGPRDFLGPYGSLTQPQALLDGTMSCRQSWCENLAGAMMIDASLEPGDTKTVALVMGAFSTEQERDGLIKQTLAPDYRQAEWAHLLESKKRMVNTVRVNTPDEQINTLTNIWVKQQIQLCVEFGRDGARGFRDTLQDAWSAAPFNSQLARDKIIETLRHQYSDGHAIRGWMPIQPHHYSDGPVWIIMAVCGYLKETGDFDFLQTDVPWLDEGSATVLGHMFRSVEHLSEDVGEHGLVLAHDGDWNDSLNWMGKSGKGESVWTSIGLYHALILMEELCRDVLEDDAQVTRMVQLAEQIKTAINTHGWDGEWYLAGYSDAGEKVGSKENSEGQCYLNPQSWALMSGLAEGERKELCLKAIDELLESEHGTLTLTPAYTARDENVGRVSMLLPGMYENGTPYCHGTAFKIVSDCVTGRPDQALASFHKVMPDSADHPSTVSGCEPYAYTNQYLGPDNGRAGASISGWITGTAGWMFRVVTDYFCGVVPGYNGFTVEPCLPSGWNQVEIERELRGKSCRIHIERDGSELSVTLNGQPLEDHFVNYDFL